MAIQGSEPITAVSSADLARIWRRTTHKLATALEEIDFLSRRPIGVERDGFVMFDKDHYLFCHIDIAARYARHHWRARTVGTPYGRLACRCSWWQRLARLVTGL